jgi:hypothetical protein
MTIVLPEPATADETFFAQRWAANQLRFERFLWSLEGPDQLAASAASVEAVAAQ